MPNDPRMEESVVKARKTYALYHYSKSISELARILSERREGAEEVAMINCVIYIVVDFLWGNVATSIAHLHSGSEILKQWKKKLPRNREVDETSLEANFTRVYDTMAHQASEVAVKQEIGTTNLSPDCTDFENFTDARSSIEAIATDGLHLVRPISLEHDVTATTERRQELQKSDSVHKARLDTWRARFEGILTKSELDRANKNSKQRKEDISTMLLLYLSSTVWLWDGGCPKEEQPLKLCGQLIHVSELMLAESEDSVEDRNRVRMTLFDTRIWPSLAILAAKCEDSDLRKRAVAILARTRPNKTARETVSESTLPRREPNANNPKFVAESEGNWGTWIDMSSGK